MHWKELDSNWYYVWNNINTRLCCRLYCSLEIVDLEMYKLEMDLQIGNGRFRNVRIGNVQIGFGNA